ncbi:MAG: FkbM family methyltransferase [Saprospiraceae bacterium]|nr:FkbM family methyltransferase [Saprospiraceae bacterium]
MARITKIIRDNLPRSIQNFISSLFEEKRHKVLRSNIIEFLEKNPNEFSSKEVEPIVKFLKNSTLNVFPYEFVNKYKVSDIKVTLDVESNFYYVLYKGKRLYFKKSMNVFQIQNAMRNLLIEQDSDSPHNYQFDKLPSKLNRVIDVGASEGIFSLNMIEDAEEIYIFETDEEWVEPLKLTFRNYLNKVHIISKFVSNVDDNQSIKLDTLFNSKQIDLIKIDVDGEEQNLLAGSVELLKNSKISNILLCTYHKRSDFKDFSTLLTNCKFTLTHSPGYMLFFYDPEFSEPYLRRGLIYAKLQQVGL